MDTNDTTKNVFDPERWGLAAKAVYSLGKALREFWDMSDSPWIGQEMFQQIQREIKAHPALRTEGVVILDESADAKAGEHSVGAARQRNGRLGKVDLCQVATKEENAATGCGLPNLFGAAIVRVGVF